jgi:hypothetical protein
MSDFLTRLAARAVGAAPVVQPRLPSLFESGAQSHRPLMEVNVQREAENIHNNQTVSPEVKQARMSGQPVPINTPLGELPAAIKPDIYRRAPHLELPPTQRSEQQGESAPPLAATSEITPSPRAAAEAKSKASSLQVIEHLHDIESEQTVVPREHESEWPLIQSKVRQLISDRLSAFPTSQMRDEKSADKKTEPVPSSVRIAAPAQPSQIRPAEILIREPMLTSEAPAPINVTIGRVEVRAVFTPASQQPRVAKDARPPTASLDEYLKKRSGVSR